MGKALLSLSVLMVTASAVRADLSSTPVCTIAPLSTALGTPFVLFVETNWLAPRCEAAVGPIDTDSAESSAFNAGLVPAAFGPFEEFVARDRVSAIQLPPPPSGDTLCLTGLLSIGALQLVRRAGQGRLGGLSSFYRSGIVSLSPDEILPPSEVDLLPICAFEYPSDQIFANQLTCHARQEPVFCRESRSFPPTTAPRAPPFSSQRPRVLSADRVFDNLSGEMG
jgi:hypothetical protein